MDSGETTLQAVIREAKEEIGWILNPALLVKMTPRISKGETPYETTPYFYAGPTDQILVPEKGLKAEFLDYDILLDPATCPFWEFNNELVSELREFHE